MKIKNANAGSLTNFEVLDFLRSKGAGKDPSRVIAPVAPSVYKVYDYLIGTPAVNQTREQINELLEKSKKYDLAKAESLNIINVRPSEFVEIYPLIENFEARLGGEEEELLDFVNQILPPPPSQLKDETTADENQDEAKNAEENDNDATQIADKERFGGDGEVAPFHSFLKSLLQSTIKVRGGQTPQFAKQPVVES